VADSSPSNRCLFGDQYGKAETDERETYKSMWCGYTVRNVLARENLSITCIWWPFAVAYIEVIGKVVANQLRRRPKMTVAIQTRVMVVGVQSAFSG
jgi:hypothetical protein